MANKSSRNWNTIWFNADTRKVAMYDKDTELTNVKLFEVSPQWVIPICYLIETNNIKTVKLEGEVMPEFISYCEWKGIKVCRV